MSKPEITRCPDGHFRRTIYGVGPYVADYPEQTLATGVVQGWCPKCLKDRDELGDPADAICRYRRHTEQLVADLDFKTLWDDYGIISNIIVSSTDLIFISITLIATFVAFYQRFSPCRYPRVDNRRSPSSSYQRNV